MAIVVNMPRLSDTMEEGTVATWLKKVGDKVEEGDILAEIETDKATMEFESFNEGTLLHIGVQEGETTKVDELLAIIGDEGEDISGLLNGGSAPAEAPAEESSSNSEEAPAAEAPAQELPEGVIVVTMPRLSDTMEEGTVATWLKKVGDTVEEGDILAEIETDKATMEFESFQSGTLLEIGLQEGESAKVDSLLAIIGPAGTDVSGVASGFSAPAAKTETAPKAEAPKAAAPAPAKAESKPSAPKPTPVTENGRVFVSPLAKKLAEEKGINLTKVQGTGENGRIVKRDIENYEPAAAVAESTAVASFAVAGEEKTEEVKNSSMRKAIAKSLGKSKFTAPHFYLNIEVDMDNAIASRKTINAIPDTKVSFNDMVVKACAMALVKHPQVNTTWDDNATKFHSHIHVGVAVAVDDGLVVPVIKHTNALSLTQIGSSVRDLAGKARNKKIKPDEMSGSTFTVSNLGMFGIQSFTSIINQPNSAILSVGAIVQKPVVKDGQIVVGNTMMLTLACDHRTVDGAVGAQFLQTLKTFIENPVTMIA
ncbi:2-oxo acid dehydrogenase subunit E2 [Tamlana sp. 62-3]|uniref:Dihydrolipoamide acetyltransferase component of pyruvate dehydrogenase complex n=1 Tax=Neotamlana sargassicola TaxID=2883125 RepID=A0A9X1L6E8_9FLAO|nr:pyruvate dehydrogenase complex dihydrolipoamide acetyltransferase [Tamlana sargassicola]MCB4807681.1 2-oxo acid dehydrogenase subunit E2 [Tamlana sargassicola]